MVILIETNQLTISAALSDKQKGHSLWNISRQAYFRKYNREVISHRNVVI